MEYGLLYGFIACIIGFTMTWTVGANDLANIMSTTMGSKAIRLRYAILIAIIFEFAGAFWGGTHVTDTIRNGIINTQLLTHDPNILIYAMLAVLFASTTWMLTASILGMPVSITNATVGALVGFGAIVLGVHTVHWDKVIAIAISWVCSPTIASIIAFILFNTIKKCVLGQADPLRAAKRMAPIYLFITGIILSIMLALKGLAHFGYHFSMLHRTEITLLTSLLIVLGGLCFIYRIPAVSPQDRHEQFVRVEKIFGILMALTACAMVFAHGSNDVAIAVGPIAAIINVITHNGQIVNSPSFPGWIMLIGVVGVILGLCMYGRKVIQTVGSSITALTPSRAFAATLAAASTVIVSTSTGIPVSATQTLVGAVLGVGLARGIGALNLTVIRNILISWVVTIPISAGLAIVYFFIIKMIFNH